MTPDDFFVQNLYVTVWTKTIAHVDLSLHKSWNQNLSDKECSKYLGGRSLSVSLLLNHKHLLGDDFPICLCPGLLVSTGIDFANVLTISSRSPQTGAVNHTLVEGKAGKAIKTAGFDGIVLKGVSKNWCAVVIDKQSIKLEPLLDDSLILKTFEQYFNDYVVGFGQAALNDSYLANLIINGEFNTGRAGIGLTLARKKIACIVIKKDCFENLQDQQRVFAKVNENLLRLACASPALLGQQGISKYGDGALFDLMHSRRMMPTKNFIETFFEKAPRLNAPAMVKKYKPVSQGCENCSVKCKKIQGKSRLPGFEELSHFSALINNENLETVIRAVEICQKLGLDPVSAAVTIACKAEIDNCWPKAEELFLQINSLAEQGSQLSFGAAAYARKRGRQEVSMTCGKDLELPAFDPRGAYGLALALAVSTTGASRQNTFTLTHEIFRKPVPTNRFSFNSKARIVKLQEDTMVAADSLGICRNAFYSASLLEFLPVIGALTGRDMTSEDLLLCGHRGVYGERILNEYWKIDSSHDDLPERFFKEPGTPGPGFAVPALDRDEFLKTRQKYYKIRQLDDGGCTIYQRALDLGVL